jgi:OOP family OmpA-OmpF porin
MRIIITGFIVLVIWSFLSMWLYVDILKPATKASEPVTVPVDSAKIREADSLAALLASIPPKLVILFEFDKVIFTPDAATEASVAKFSEWLGKYPASVLLVTGHSDFIGEPEYNTGLGMKRAEAVRAYLLEKGVNESRMTVSSKGEDQPAFPPFTSDGIKQNRRTEVEIKHQ